MSDEAPVEAPTLYVIATPLGNARDFSFRAVEVLRGLTALACEDTRVTWKLLGLHDLGRPRTMFSYHDHNERFAAERIVGLLRSGVSVGLCSDAGTPGLADPGYRAIRAAIEAGFPVVSIPGANAAVSALVVSGLPTSSYTFLGFPPRKSGQRRNFLLAEAERAHTLVLYESPHRLGALLADAREVLGDRAAAVCIELTKRYEEVARGFLADLAARFATEKPRGEITVVIAGKHDKFVREDAAEGEE